MSEPLYTDADLGGVSVTIPITVDNLPKGPRWDADGACYEAVAVPSLPDGWYWQACNLKALEKGYEGQTLYDHAPITWRPAS